MRLYLDGRIMYECAVRQYAYLAWRTCQPSTRDTGATLAQKRVSFVLSAGAVRVRFWRGAAKVLYEALASRVLREVGPTKWPRQAAQEKMG
jgi:hypothetical protein